MLVHIASDNMGEQTETAMNELILTVDIHVYTSCSMKAAGSIRSSATCPRLHVFP